MIVECKYLASPKIYGIVLGDNSGKLWGVPEESYSVEEKEIGNTTLPR